MPRPPEYFGTVIRYFPDRGFGFISGVKDDGETKEEVWFHVKNITNMPPVLKVGAQMVYDRVPGKKLGQFAATNIIWYNNGDIEPGRSHVSDDFDDEFDDTRLLERLEYEEEASWEERES